MKDGAEQRLHEVVHVGDGDVAVHHHAFHLIKGVLVRSVHLFVAEDAPRRDHTQRRAQALHAAHLNRRGVCSQQVAIGKPESILHVARGMRGGNVERIEIVIFGFHFGAVQHRESERGEQVFDFRLYARDWMEAAWAWAGCRQRKIEPFCLQALIQRTSGECFFPGFEGGFDCLPRGVKRFAGRAALGGTKFSNVDLCERSFAAEHVHADGLELVGILRSLDAHQGVGFELFDLVFEHYLGSSVPLGCGFI